MHLNARRWSWYHCITPLNEDIQVCQSPGSPPLFKLAKRYTLKPLVKKIPCCATIISEQLEGTSHTDHVDQREMSSRFVAPQI